MPADPSVPLPRALTVFAYPVRLPRVPLPRALTVRFSCSPAPRRWQGGRCPLSQCHGQHGLPHCLPSGAALPQRYLLPFFPPFLLVRRPTSHCFAQPGSKMALNSSVTDACAQPPDFQSALIRPCCVSSLLHLFLDPGDCPWGVAAPGRDSLLFLLLLGKAVGFQKC